MTDNDIIKALECCLTKRCHECTIRAIFCSGRDAMAYALDLINRQKAEIEEKNGLIERLQNANVRALRGTTEIVKANAKSEAIKEFAERLKENLDDFFTSDEDALYDTASAIDNLVKEMVGEGK